MKKTKKRLSEVLKEIEDPRNGSGRRHGLEGILKMMVSGLMCGCNNTAEVVRWGRRLSKQHKEALGLGRGIPSEGALSNLFRKMDMKEVEKRLGRWEVKEKKEGERMHVAIDGKTIKGSAYKETEAVHLLSGFATKYRKVMGQIAQRKGENEISAAVRLLEELEIEGCVVSGDAIFAQKKSV